MPEKKLNEILQELHRNLENSPELDPEARAALAGASEEIRAVLGGDSRDGSLASRLSDSLSRFEGARARCTGGGWSFSATNERGTPRRERGQRPTMRGTR